MYRPPVTYARMHDAIARGQAWCCTFDGQLVEVTPPAGVPGAIRMERTLDDGTRISVRVVPAVPVGTLSRAGRRNFLGALGYLRRRMEEIEQDGRARRR
jgi:hypothetical protein